jgi:hypothetical protein
VLYLGSQLSSPAVFHGSSVEHACFGVFLPSSRIFDNDQMPSSIHIHTLGPISETTWADKNPIWTFLHEVAQRVSAHIAHRGDVQALGTTTTMTTIRLYVTYDGTTNLWDPEMDGYQTSKARTGRPFYWDGVTPFEYVLLGKKQRTFVDRARRCKETLGRCGITLVDGFNRV